MCTNFDLYRICACIFQDMCLNSDLYRTCAYIFNSQRICAQVLCSGLLDYFWMKDPLGTLEDSLGSIILLKSVLVMILTYHEVLMVYGLLKKGQLIGDFLMVCCSLGNFLPLGNNYLLISCDSLKIDVDSSLEGISPNSTREILLCNSRGSYFCALESRGSSSMILDLLGFQFFFFE